MSTWSIQPSQTRYVRLEHRPSRACWQLQFPESVVCTEGQLLDYPPFDVSWRRSRDGSLTYTHDCDEAHVRSLRQSAKGDPHQSRKSFLSGLRIQAAIAEERGFLRLTLTLSNRSGKMFHAVVCDGGCFQAQPGPFTAGRQASRTFTMVRGSAHSLTKVDRSNRERCCLHADGVEAGRECWRSGEWFWGHSKTRIDNPAIVAMNSERTGLAVAIGYQDARSILANSDEEHHCMHSCPSFGDIAPGESVQRVGWIVVGDSAPQLLNDLRARIYSSYTAERMHA